MPRRVYQSKRSSHPVLEPLRRLVGRHEVLHLHLLELARAEDEVAGRDLVAKRLADLGDAERRLLARELEDVLEVDEDPLRRLGAQVGLRARVLDRADVRLEHQVELARLGEVASRGPRPGSFDGFGGQRSSGRAGRRGSAACTSRQSTSGSVKPARWPDCLPHPRVLEDRRVERHDVVALGQHRAPPLVLDVVFSRTP